MSAIKTKILIIDDHALFADGLSLILKSLGPGVWVDVSNSASDMLIKVEVLATYDLILIDLNMPIMDGFTFLTAVRTQKLGLTVGVISGVESKKEIERAIALGADGFIPKDTPSEEMLKAVNILLEGRRYLPSHWLGEVDWLRREDDQHCVEEVTPRQLQVLGLMRDGLQNKQIAVVLGISVSAVKGHVENLFRVMSVNNRTACVKSAVERGIDF